MYSIVTYHIGNMNVNWAAYVISRSIRGNLQKKPSIFKDIIQIGVDHPPFHPIFDKLLIIFTSLPPLEFLTKVMKF